MRIPWRWWAWQDWVTVLVLLLGLGFLLFLCGVQLANAHDAWDDGTPVPAWVKEACCGPNDAHHLVAAQVHQGADGWRVDGYRRLVPNGTELPSPDGSYWIFYRTFLDGTQTSVYCFFVPIPSM